MDDIAPAPGPDTDPEKGVAEVHEVCERGRSPDLNTRSEDPTVPGERAVVLSFRGLQLERIAALQDEVLKTQLAKAKARKEHTDTNRFDNEFDQALDRYATALRNYDILSQNALSAVPPGYKFIGNGGLVDWVYTGQQKFLKAKLQASVAGKVPKIMRPWIPSWIGTIQVDSSLEVEIIKVNQDDIDQPIWFVIQQIHGRPGDQLGFRELDKAGREERERKSASALRFTMGMFGAIALIAPMLIMALHSNQKNVALITTSVATIIFALILALGGTDSSGKDVLGATAAYTAVLVVFVGTSLSGT